MNYEVPPPSAPPMYDSESSEQDIVQDTKSKLNRTDKTQKPARVGLVNRSHQKELIIMSIVNLILSIVVIASNKSIQYFERSSEDEKFDLGTFALDNIVWFTVLISSITAIIRNKMHGKYEMIWVDTLIIFVFTFIIFTYIFILLAYLVFLINTSIGISALMALDVYNIFWSPNINSSWFGVLCRIFIIVLLVGYNSYYLKLNSQNFLSMAGKTKKIIGATFIMTNIITNIILMTLLIKKYHSAGLLEFTNDCKCENGDPFEYCYAKANSSCEDCEYSLMFGTDYYLKKDGMNSYCVAGSESLKFVLGLMTVLFLLN